MRDDRGFTLLELLVAFVIAIGALGVLYRGALDGLVATSQSGRTTEAVERARSHLAAVGYGAAVVAGEQAGDDGGGYRWRVLVRQTATASVPRSAAVPVASESSIVLYVVSVTVSWDAPGGTREVRLYSERVGLALRTAP